MGICEIELDVQFTSDSHIIVIQDEYIDDLYAIMKEAYRMLVPDSIPAIKPKMGANTDPNQPSFKRLGKRMAQERQMNEKELEWVKKLDDFV